MSENIIKYSSAGNLVSFTIDKNYSISNFNIDESILSTKELLEEMIVSSLNEALSKIKDMNSSNSDNSKSNINMNDFKDMFGDISKMASFKYENGKPVLNISLDNLNQDILYKMTEFMNNKNNDKD